MIAPAPNQVQVKEVGMSVGIWSSPAYEPDYDSLLQDDRIHRSLYTEPIVFSHEMERIFGCAWVYLGHESEIPEPNDFKLTNLGTRPVILSRDADGTVRAFFNRCSHRGVTVCNQDRGNTSRFTCSYHGWTYSSSGELLNVPFSSGMGESFNLDEWGLQRLDRVDSYRGFVFGVLSDSGPSLAEHLGTAATLIDEWVDRAPDGELVVRHGTRRIVARANWKLYLDGAADGLHPFSTHRSFVEMSARHSDGLFLSQFRRDPDDSQMYSMALGNGHQYLDQRPGMDGHVWDATRPAPGTEATVGALEARYGSEGISEILERTTIAGMNVFIFPNLSLVDNSIGVVQPRSVNMTEVLWHVTSLAGAEPESLPLRLRIGEDFPNFGDPDDIENWERAQRGLELVPEVEWLHTGRGVEGEEGTNQYDVTNEGPMRAYHREWLKFMRTDDAESK